MLTLKCSSCGWEEIVTKKLDKETYFDLTNNEGMYCGRNCCKGSNFRVPKGYIRVMFVFGRWSILRQATLQEYRSIKKAKKIRDLIMNH